VPAGCRPQSAVIPAKNAVAVNAKEVATLIANRKGRSRIGRVAVIRSDRAHQQMDSESLYTCSIEGYTHGPQRHGPPAVAPPARTFKTGLPAHSGAAVLPHSHFVNGGGSKVSAPVPKKTRVRKKAGTVQPPRAPARSPAAPST